MRFNNEQTFIVTGASSGIGRSVALLLNEQGANVVAIARREDELKTLITECKNPDNMHYEVKDLTSDIEQLSEYIKFLKDKYGKFSGMAYCAGIINVVSLRTMDVSSYQQVFNINYLAPLFLTKGLADKRNNVGPGTSLVYISSLGAIAALKGQIFYAGSKSALNASIKSISRELAPKKIRCNCISPSWIKTQIFDQVNDNYNPDIGDFPFGVGTPKDVANLTAFLLSDEASWITGENYTIDGGGSIQK